MVAPIEIRRWRRNVNHSEMVRRAIEEVNAAGTAAVEVAFAVDFHSLGCPFPSPITSGENSSTGQRSVAANVENPDVLTFGVVNIEQSLVGRETQAIGLIEIVGKQRQ